MMEQGTLVISLDLELMWGVIDIATPEGYGHSNVAHVREVVRRMIDLFDTYEVKATFASVGMLMLQDVKDVKNRMPALLPTYKNGRLSPYANGYLDGFPEKYKELYFAPDLINILKKSQNIEIGTHTFCHYYCFDDGQTAEQFEADVSTAITEALNQGITIRSIIFPRNQVTKEYLSICARYGIEAYRGNPDRFFARPNSSWGVLKNRAGRLLDAYVNIGGRNSYSISSVDVSEKPINIKASRMFRPYIKKLSLLEPFRIRRIKKEMRYAAKHGEIYHLWWHPHNFGADIENNFANLREVLDCYKMCRGKYGMTSMTMDELAITIKNNR